ncbi:MAG: TPM domain-containing protein [Candidatus Moranbacteria bacterium]|nr:TPM domain-containing protein [Candidatus Moranbacteria bacterium]
MRRRALPLMAIALMGAAPLQSTGWVNDFANVIPDDREAALEQKLGQFEQQTTVEIAVVTTPSLNGEDIEGWTNRLFREWGIGKAENNNGLMVVVAPAEHSYRIEVGYGLEPFVTDAEAGRLGRDNLPDAFRQSDYAGGLDHLTDGLIQRIGRLTPKQRQAYIVAKNNEAARQAKNAAARKAMFWEHVGNFLAGILSLGGSIFGVFYIRRKWRQWQARRRLRKSLRVRLVSLADFYRKKTSESVLHVSTSLDAVPRWIQREILQHEAGLAEAIHHLHEHIYAAQKQRDRSEEDLKLKAAKVGQAEEAQAKYEEHESALGAIPSKIEEVRAQAADQVVRTSEAVTALKYFADSLSKKGLKFPSIYKKGIEEDIEAKLRTLKALLANRVEGQDDESEQIIGLAETLQATITELGDKLNAVSTRLSSIEELHDDLKGRIEACEDRYAAFQSVATRLREGLPEEQAHEVELHWQRALQAKDLRTAFRAIPIDAKLQASKQQGLIRSLRVLEESVTSVEVAYSQIQAVAEQYDHARSGGYEKALGQAGTAIRSATRVLESQDVGMAARNTFGQAMSTKVKAVESAHQPKPDWIGSVILLEEAARLARQAQVDAERDIQSAERVREQAEQRRRDKARRDAEESRESTIISSGSGRSDDDDDDSGGFGGFGGGDSGGGGASGRW